MNYTDFKPEYEIIGGRNALWLLLIERAAFIPVSEQWLTAACETH